MITVSLETAKRLRKAGWNKPTYFIWYFENKEYTLKYYPFFIVDTMQVTDDLYAPTLQEILEELPHRVNLYIAKDHYCIATTVKEYPIIKDKNPVEAAAELWMKINSK